jgi:hypothetical protein
MLFDSLILPGVLIPSAFAVAVVLIAAWVSRRRTTDSTGAGLAVAAAFLSAFVAATGWPRWPPVGSSQKLFYLVAAAAVAGLVTAALRRRSATWFAHGALIAALLLFLLQPKLDTWSGGQAALWLAGLLLAGVAVAWAWGVSLRSTAEPDDPTRSDTVSAAVRATVVGGSAVVLGLSESALLAQLAGAVACGAVVVELAGRVLRRRPWQSTDAAVIATALVGLLVIGHFYAGLKPLPAVLLVLAYLLLALPGDRWWHRLAPLLPLAVALGIVVAAVLTKADDPYDYSSLPAALAGATAPGDSTSAPSGSS